MPQMRNTPQRQLIVSILKETDKPLLPNDILLIAQKTMPKVGIATVFRALKDLVAEGQANAVHITGDPTRYEGSERGHHHHFKCLSCGQVIDFYTCPGNLGSLLPDGYQMTGHDLTIYGECPDCAA